MVANRYQIKTLIDRGSMGEVFLAEDMLLGGTPVAIKFLSQTVTDPQIQESFNREALLSAALSQKSIHIVRAYDYGVTNNGNPYYVMEYLSGQSLKELIPLPIPMFLNLSRQICLGLKCAHQGVNIDGKVHPLVHRDIKPANIIVTPDPILGKLAKILDFGIAKFLNNTGVITASQGFHGTLPYCSPEQLEGGNLDSRSDIYSLGVMMFEMLTGQKPWQPETDGFGAWYRVHLFEPPKHISDINPHLQIPQQLNDLIMNCLAKKPEQRPQNMAKILQVLENIEQSTDQISLASGLRNTVSSKQRIIPDQQFIWPESKPIQEIVFPQLITEEKVHKASLWLMLPQSEIQNYAYTTRYTRFIFITHPHPMLLWITLLYDRDLTPKWLPCYLDMKNSQNLKLMWTLAETECYSLLFFALEPPHHCTNIFSLSISPPQTQNLKSWVQQSLKLTDSNQTLISKNWLKQQYKEIQLKILKHLEA
nr:serine/threonine-protein kinase [Anabaena sp. UHCC 0187]